jgi:glycosyltransferase involved in cell wall biosynthesis
MKLSIIIANYNREMYIARAIRSCINQQIFRTKYEILVIDDGSTDDSMKVIQEFNSDIRLIQNRVNMGVAFASNIGLENAKGEYWMRVDSDDFISQFSCQYMIDILDHNTGIDFVYSDHYRIDTNGLTVDTVRLDNNEALFMHGAGVMFRKSVLDKVGGYDNSLRNAEDYDLLLRILRAGYKGYHIPVPLYRYYIHGENITLQNDREISIQLIKERYDI